MSLLIVIGLLLVDWIEAMTLVGLISPLDVTVTSFWAKREKNRRKLTNKAKGIIKSVAKLW